MLALAVFLAQYFWYEDTRRAAKLSDAERARSILAHMPRPLARLLVAECLVRIGEGIAASFIVLFVLHTRHVAAPTYGWLYAVQQTVAIASYLPGGRIADATGRRPVVALTLLFFAAFPLAVRLPLLIGR